MLSPIGYYFDQDAYHDYCAGQEIRDTGDPIFSYSESDSYPTCEKCKDQIECCLTSEGIKYITEQAIDDIKQWNDLIQQIADIREVNEDDFSDTLLSVIGTFVDSFDNTGVTPVHYWDYDSLDKRLIVDTFLESYHVDPEKYTRQDIRQLLEQYPDSRLDYCGTMPKSTKCILVYPHTKYYQYLDPDFIAGYKLEIYDTDDHFSYHEDIDSLVSTLQDEKLTLNNWSI